MTTPNTSHSQPGHSRHTLPFNIDFLAIGIALTLAALIRFGIIHQITF